MVRQQGKFFNSRRSRMAKTVTFWTSVSFLIASAWKLSFFPLLPFATQKSEGAGGMGAGWGHGFEPPGVASPVT